MLTEDMWTLPDVIAATAPLMAGILRRGKLEDNLRSWELFPA